EQYLRVGERLIGLGQFRNFRREQRDAIFALPIPIVFCSGVHSITHGPSNTSISASRSDCFSREFASRRLDSGRNAAAQVPLRGRTNIGKSGRPRALRLVSKGYTRNQWALRMPFDHPIEQFQAPMKLPAAVQLTG